MVVTTMRSRYHGVTLAAVRDPLRVSVEFDTPAEPIAGTLSVDGERHPFTGWLGLMSGLQRVVDDPGLAGSARVGNREHDA